jgi:hypothetical protein
MHSVRTRGASLNNAACLKLLRIATPHGILMNEETAHDTSFLVCM